MLTKREWLIGVDAESLRTACERELAAIRTTLDVDIERVLRAGTERVPALQLDRQRAVNAEEAARLALDAAITHRRQVDAALETARVEPRKEERRVRAAAVAAMEHRRHRYDVDVDEAWHTYLRTHRPAVMVAR